MRGLDDTDRALLRLLTENARRPYSELAERVDLSGPAVSDRIDRLQELGVLRRFTADLDRSLLGGGTPVLVDLHVRPGAVDAVQAGVTGIDAAEHVFRTADARIVFTARVPEGDIDGLLDGAIEMDDVRQYEVSLLADSSWDPDVGEATFAPDCVECGNTVTEEGSTVSLDGDLYHFCCDSCESRFTERYEEHRSAASG